MNQSLQILFTYEHLFVFLVETELANDHSFEFYKSILVKQFKREALQRKVSHCSLIPFKYSHNDNK